MMKKKVVKDSHFGYQTGLEVGMNGMMLLWWTSLLGVSLYGPLTQI